jgi:hypothetical protein
VKQRKSVDGLNRRDELFQLRRGRIRSEKLIVSAHKHQNTFHHREFGQGLLCQTPEQRTLFDNAWECV